jgi:hypothetical protein
MITDDRSQAALSAVCVHTACRHWRFRLSLGVGMLPPRLPSGSGAARPSGVVLDCERDPTRGLVAVVRVPQLLPGGRPMAKALEPKRHHVDDAVALSAGARLRRLAATRRAYARSEPDPACRVEPLAAGVAWARVAWGLGSRARVAAESRVLRVSAARSSNRRALASGARAVGIEEPCARCVRIPRSARSRALQNVEPEHPPDKEEGDQCPYDVTDPLAHGLRFSAVFHARISAF